MPQFRDPPSSISGALGEYLRDIATYINSVPSISRVSLALGESPNSRYTGSAGDFLVDVGSASTQSRLWLMGGAANSARTMLGWSLVRIVQA